MSKTIQVFEPLTEFKAHAAVLSGPNMDTDQIIPARFLKKDRSQGYGQYLFFDARFDEAGQAKADHPLSAMPQPQILIVDENFGCGSSREGAVYALVDYGIRVVIGTTFGDIFHNNCFKNGLLPIRLSPEDHKSLRSALFKSREITVDLPAQIISWETGQVQFAVDAFWKECLTKGLDDLSLTLSYQAEIDHFEEKYRNHFPWMVPAR
ncbi:3-isopropylmalate dehydratase small subunit [Orrella daihaiensis]|uniref:3-isopropylmalate dehydratase n=1 Tax=Orrella daihaiensis TaxID=2782176 RepID=A0ABY4AIK0_9BURK|nr:3-isopropylmalate dehydratase small subunit [Orrella daihaiensis]UOD50004.1 3-isopropylmalate dehydratase small subunit [Orrella daihaiensis]